MIYALSFNMLGNCLFCGDDKVFPKFNSFSRSREHYITSPHRQTMHQGTCKYELANLRDNNNCKHLIIRRVLHEQAIVYTALPYISQYSFLIALLSAPYSVR
jgi:hypothetical protein